MAASDAHQLIEKANSAVAASLEIFFGFDLLLRPAEHGASQLRPIHFLIAYGKKVSLTSEDGRHLNIYREDSGLQADEIPNE